MRRSAMFFVVTAALTGCATDINMKNAERYYEAGLRLEFAKDYAGAKEAYRRSLINAQSGGQSPALISAATYNLGRMTGYTCDYAEAKSLLLESIALEQALPKPEPGNMTKRWSELARLYQDERRDRDAVMYFAKAVPELDRRGEPNKNPIGYAIYLDDCARSLKITGQDEAAGLVSLRAADLRAKHEGRAAGFVALRFNDVCQRK